MATVGHDDNTHHSHIISESRGVASSSHGTRLMDIPMEIWQSSILEYLIGPIHQYQRLLHHQCLNSRDDDDIQLNTIEEIMKFKSVTYKQICNGLDLKSVRTLNILTGLVCRGLREMFLVRMDEFWLRVSNMLAMVVYWRRYETSQGVTLAKGDMTVDQSIPFVTLQKLIEATEMNVNREYCEIIDPDKCTNRYGAGTDDDQWKTKKNDVDTEWMYKEFENRFAKLMISPEKYEKIRKTTQNNAYNLFLHSAFELSLDMISYYDSERSSNCYDGFRTEEQCRLFDKGLFNQNPEPNALGLIISEDQLVEIDSKFIAVAINSTEWGNTKFTNIPKSIQYLCLNFNHESVKGYRSLIEKCLFDDDSIFPNVRGLTIRIGSPEDDDYFLHSRLIEKNILSGVTRKRFPKLIRISISGFESFTSLLECEIVNQLLYVDIIQCTRGYDYDMIYHWSERKVHELVKCQFLNDSLIHHLVIHACISRCCPDADYDSIKEYYNLTKSKFVASISHSSFNEYYEKCYE